MNYEIVTLKEKLVVGISIKTSNENLKSVQDIGALWQRFVGEGINNMIEDKVDHKAIGLYTEYEGDFTKPFKFMCCCEVSAIDHVNGYEVKKIPSGKYAKFTLKGNRTKVVGEAWQQIWQSDIDRKYSCDFEVYHNDGKDLNNETIEIFISLN